METKRLSCSSVAGCRQELFPGPKGHPSNRCEQGGRSTAGPLPSPRGNQYAAQAKSAPSAPDSVCACPYQAATTVSKSALGCPTTHPYLQVALSLQKGIWKETVIPSYRLSENRCYWGNNLLRFLFLFEILKYNICIHMYT